MKLNKNSFSASLYQFFYNTNDLPNNLCPYFWQLIIAYIFVLPLTLFNLPFFLIIQKNKNARFKREKRDNWVNISLISVVLYVVAFLVISYIIGAWYGFPYIVNNIEPTNLYTQFSSALFIAVSLLVLLSLLLLFFFQIIVICEELLDRNKDEKTSIKEKSIIIEFIKAKYNNYCPRIDWE